MKYCSYKVEFPTSVLNVVGDYTDEGDRLEFRAILEYTNKRVVYKFWQRKKLGHFDEQDLPDSDPKVEKVAETFRRMGEETFKNRFKTLAMTRPKA